MLSENPGESIWIFSIPANFPENKVYPKRKRNAFYAVLFIGGLCLSDPNKGCRMAGGFLDENLENLSGPGIVRLLLHAKPRLHNCDKLDCA
ncbi:hypothetical protein OIU84_014152 [Salix udensis]|uniref:Uncharacterized protein n=1 Tax=Salix udensis TaxID=889485 RepID=A0AAD6JBV2_9ROSI|nr:hypothetical protein OIU84_014152 [Salix udensis]